MESCCDRDRVQDFPENLPEDFPKKFPKNFPENFPETQPVTNPHTTSELSESNAGLTPDAWDNPADLNSGVAFSCPVELSTTAQGRQRELCASIQIPCSVDPVWRVLTSYDRLAEIIPSLNVSRRLPHPEGDQKVRLEQVASQTILKKMNFSARVVLDMEEDYPHKIHFAMVEGDFKMLKGCWMLESVEVEGKPHTRLSYRLAVLPKLTMPVQLMENQLRKDLTTNLEAIYRFAIAAQASGEGLSPA